MDPMSLIVGLVVGAAGGAGVARVTRPRPDSPDEPTGGSPSTTEAVRSGPPLPITGRGSLDGTVLIGSAGSAAVAVPGAIVKVMKDGSEVATVKADGQGEYWVCLEEGSYTLEADVGPNSGDLVVSVGGDAHATNQDIFLTPQG